jgi:hypothetical protein
MKIHFRSISLSVLLFTTPTLSVMAVEKPYEVQIWSSVMFNTEGSPTEIRIEKESEYPAKFIEAVKARIAATTIDAAMHQGHAATYKTGILMGYTITPSDQGASVSLDEFKFSPLPLRQTIMGIPSQFMKEGSWEGKVISKCTVGIEGVCIKTESYAESGTLPEAIRRFVKDTMAKWKFEPQSINGQPIEGEFTWELNLNEKTVRIQDPQKRR